MKPDQDIVYLSGPMSGLEGYNFDEFARWARILREAGYVVLNPAETAGGVDHLPRHWYFRFDFAMVAIVDYIFVMPGWTDSAGAKAEAIMAQEMGVRIFELADEGGEVFEEFTLTEIHDLSWDVSFRKGDAT